MRLEPRGYQTAPIFLRSGVVLDLPAGCVLEGSPDIADYDHPEFSQLFQDAVGQVRGRALVNGLAIQNAGLSGAGEIRGLGSAFTPDLPRWAERPMLVRFSGCQELAVSGLHLRDAAAWTLHVAGSNSVRIDGLRVTSRVNSNNDGIDIDGCSHVLVKDCDISTSDDGICLKTTGRLPCRDVSVRSCTIRSEAGALKIGTESSADIENVTYRDCRIEEAGMGAVKLIATDGGSIRNVDYVNTTVSHSTGPIFAFCGRRNRLWDGIAPEPVSRMEKIRFERMHVRQPAEWPAERFGVVLSGMEDSPFRDLRFADCLWELPGGCQTARPAADYPRRARDYPEQFFFGESPAAVLFARNVDGIAFQGSAYSLRHPDARSPVVFENCRHVTGALDPHPGSQAAEFGSA